MSRTQQDQFIDDDEEETCPLCVEEFDLTDKGFRPCPCGYQICQFCYHNVKNNMNGLCPACRRPYEEKNIEYKVITPEETAAHKARQAQKQKKTQAAIQKEKQKAEADHLSRKHLAGLRVVQKNLVYVTGLSPTSQEDQLLQTLRGDQYFGQYGKIIKIVVSKARDPAHPNSVGVYVTYERKEDAQACIVAVNGSKNGDRTLRAQFGTTKYCSAYLRNEQCTNRNCMFLHEPGEANESYSRADLSALNAGSSQHGDSRPPPPQSQQPIASAAPPSSTLSGDSSSSAPDRPALPSTASWASKPPYAAPTRPESRATAGSVGSPAVSSSTPVSAPAEPTATTSHEPPVSSPAPQAAESAPIAKSTTKSTKGTEKAEVPAVPAAPKPQRTSTLSPLVALLKNFMIEDLAFQFDTTAISQADLDVIKNYPPLFDSNGGARRRLRRQREEEQRRVDQEVQAFAQAATEQDDPPEMSGSLQLGGEPEERQSTQSTVRSPVSEGLLDQRFRFGDTSTTGGTSERGMTPQSHQQLLLQTMKGATDSNSYLGQGSTFPNSSGHANVNAPPGHQRNVSRYSFANESASASMSVKPVASSKLLNQQSSMMPPTAGSQFGTSQDLRMGNQQFYTSNVQGPPPGLKTTGTPPVSGGMTFGQGHGFTTGGLQYGANAGRHNNVHEENMRNLLRGPNAEVSAKRDVDFPPLGPPSRQHSISIHESRHSTPPIPPGFEATIGNESRRSTPAVPPGFVKPTALPHLEDDGSISRPGSRPTSRPSSRASLRRQASQHIVPALPLRTGTPSRPSTPSTNPARPDGNDDPGRERDVHQTPTKLPRSVVKQAAALVEKGAPVSQETTKTLGATRASADVAGSPDTSLLPAKHPAPEGKVKPSASGTSSNKITAPETPVKPGARAEDVMKRKPPGKLDTTTAVHEQTAASANQVPVTTPGKPGRSVVPPTSKPASPVAGGASPAPRNGPKTLRLVGPQTPQTPQSSVSASALPSNIAQNLKQPSRQPSMASMNVPGTPSSEQISFSDNVSITSTSLSRANSPPPMASKVGTAPVRTKTKNQMKKERQERAKAMEEEKAKVEETVKPVEEEPAQEAIVSRKKKTRKEKEPRQKSKGKPSVVDEQAVPSRPASPVQKATPVPVPRPVPVAAAEKPAPVPVPAPLEPAQPSREPSPPPTPTLTPASLLADLKASSPEIQKCIDALFRTPTTNQFKPGQNITQKDLRNPAFWKTDFKINLTKDEVEALMKEMVPAIRYGGEDGRVWDRGLITPSGAHIRAMSEELENRFMQLEKALRDMPDELRFHPSKPQNETKFPTIDLDELRRQFENANGRGVSVMEQMVQDGSNMKKGAFLVDEASKYINEFVMPPATPPPSSGKGTQQGNHGPGPQSHHDAFAGFSPDILERHLHEAKRLNDERESALRKIIKKNKKLLGFA